MRESRCYSKLLFEHLAEVRRYLQAAPHMFLSLDFDGTLAPIVPNPADASILPPTRSILESLNQRPNLTMAVISGRSIADLKSRVRLDLILAGNHGLEICGRGWQFRQPQAAGWQPLLHQLCDELRTHSASIPGSLIEDKGLTASVHLRNVAAPDRSKVRDVVRSVIATHSDRFTVRQGNKVLEILPRVDWHKGSAILWMLQKLRANNREEVSCCAIGDDTTDEDAFRVLASGITIRVGFSATTSARFRVRNTAGVCKFLNWLAAS